MRPSIRAAIYLRQSLDVAGDELGITRQRSECERLCSARRYDIVETITDNSVSASKHGRKGYSHLIELIERRAVDVVVILRIDRLLRLNDELEQLIALSETTGVTVVTVEGDIDLATPSGRLVARVLVSVARAEMETKSARHKLANAQKAARGAPHGSRRPYGYEDDLVTIREPEAALLREMGRRVLAGHSYKSVAHWLNQQGHTTTTGKLWYPLTVRNMLRKPRYGGIREYNGHQYPASWSGVFDADTWAKLQLVMDARRDSAPVRQNARKYLLTGLAHCGGCGLSLTGSVVKDSWDKRRNRKRYGGRMYSCRAVRDTGLVRGCGGVRRNADALDHFVRERVLHRLDTPELGKLLTATGSEGGGQLKALLSDRQHQQRLLDGFVDDYATGTLSKAQFIRAKSTAESELRRLDQEIERQRRESMALDVPVGQTLRQVWEARDVEWRRELIGLVVKKLTVNKGVTKPFYEIDGGRRCRFDPHLIEIEWLV